MPSSFLGVSTSSKLLGTDFISSNDINRSDADAWAWKAYNTQKRFQKTNPRLDSHSVVWKIMMKAFGHYGDPEGTRREPGDIHGILFQVAVL